MLHRYLPIAGFVLLLASAFPVRAADGWFDPQFGVGGALAVPIEGYYDDLAATRVLPDGKFMLGGTCSRLRPTGQYVTYFCLARLQRNGGFDPGFGPSGTGHLLSDQLVLPTMSMPYVTAMGLLPDGHVVIAGGANMGPVVLLVNADGTTASFAYALFNGSAPESEFIRALAVQPDGKILLAGRSAPIGLATEDFAVMRLLPNLALDPTFGNGGVAYAGFAASGHGGGVAAITLQRDGKIVLAGAVSASPGRDFAVARLLANGQLDTSFNGSGRTMFDVAADDTAVAVTIDRHGRIVVAGYASPYASGGWGVDFIVHRLLADGTRDPSFGGPIDVYVDYGGDKDDVLRSLLLQGDGKILVAGRSSYSDTKKVFSVARLNEDGSQDTGFGITGRSAGTFVPGDTSVVWAEGVSLALGGGLYVFGNGRTTVGSEHWQSFGIARLQLDAVFQGDFEP